MVKQCFTTIYLFISILYFVLGYYAFRLIYIVNSCFGFFSICNDLVRAWVKQGLVVGQQVHISLWLTQFLPNLL